MHEWNYYGEPYRLLAGMYVVGDYVYDWYPQSGDLFILASPSADYGPEKKVKVAAANTVNAIVDEIIAKGRKVNKEESRAERLRISNKRAAAPKPSTYVPPATTTPAADEPAPATSLIPTWIYDPTASWYTQGYFYALLATGGIAVAMNWDAISKMLGLNEEEAKSTLANPRKNRMKKYSNPRMNRKNRRKNREVEEEVEEVDEDEE